MADLTEITETIPFNFDEVYKFVEDKFIEKGYDSIYEGSNTAQLITAMSYMVSMLNTNTAVNINELILPLARKRNNVLNDARILGYEISHISSYKYKLTLLMPEGNSRIPKYTEFKSGNYTYYYLDDDIEIQNATTIEERTKVIEVKEGILHKFNDEPDVLKITTGTINVDGENIPQYYIDIPYIDVEEDGLETFLTYYDENGMLISSEPWKKSDKFMIDKDSALDKEYIRLDNIELRTPRIYFTLAGVGQGIRVGTIVEINVLVSNGTKGEMLDIPSTDLDAEIQKFELSRQGTTEESIESIKINAPMFHNSANRAVTKVDYTSICNRQSSILDSEVWGGDDEHPKIPGHIWFSFTPSNKVRNFTSDEFNTLFNLDDAYSLTNWYLEDEEIRSTIYDSNGNLIQKGVFDVLDEYKIPTLEFHNRHPLYLDFEYTIQILKYNIKTSKSDINNDIFNVIDNYFKNTTTGAEQFNFEYFHSSLEKRIDTDLSDITGFNNTVKTYLILNSKTIFAEKENKDNYECIVNFNIPFEKYFDGTDLLPEYLPNLDTNLVDGTNNLYVDWTGLTENAKDLTLIEAPIRFDTRDKNNPGTSIAGRYYLFNDYRKYIIIKLYIQDDTGAPDDVYADSPLTKSLFDNTVKLNYNYFSPNFRVKQNVIPRLKTVQFI